MRHNNCDWIKFKYDKLKVQWAPSPFFQHPDLQNIYVKSNYNCYLFVHIDMFAYITYLNAHLETKYCTVNMY